MFRRLLRPHAVPAAPTYLQRDSTDEALTALGRRAARELLDPDGHGPHGRVSWSATLQLAADRSHQHPEILRIADEIHVAARDIRSAAGIRIYAVSTLHGVRSTVAVSFLIGMFETAAARPGS